MKVEHKESRAIDGTKTGEPEGRARSLIEPATRIGLQALRGAQSALDALFEPMVRGVGGLTGAGWFSGLYVLGLVLWGYLLDWGDIPLVLHDWAEASSHRLAFLKDAVMTGQLPLHMSGGWALRNVTDRFISVPDTLLSPQVFLMRFMDVGHFAFVNTLLLYTAGFIGLLLLARRFQLSPFVAGTLAVLFSLNGHITTHVVVGHAHWVAYYLLPYFVLLVFELLEAQADISWILRMGMLMLIIFLQGGYHLYVVLLMFLGLLGVAGRRLLRPLAGALAATLLLSLGRILPAALNAADWDTEFLSGFVSVAQLFEATLVIRRPVPGEVFTEAPLSTLGWWEIDHYLGFLGLAFILVFGIVYWWQHRGEQERMLPLVIPIFGLLFLSIGRIGKPLNMLGLPLISSQRVATRLAMVPLVFLMCIAARHLQTHLQDLGRGSRGRVVYLGLLALGFHDLWQHIKLWRVRHMYDLFPQREVDLSLDFVANHPDPPYELALVVGWGVALVTLGLLIALVVRQRRRRAAALTTTQKP